MYPLDWDEVFEYIGFPAFLKPYSGGGWKSVYKVDNPDEFFRAYDDTGDLCMTLQTGVEFKEYFRCYVVGQQKVHVMQYDPRLPHAQRYVHEPRPVDPALLARVESDARKLCVALGYDLNTVEFAVEDGIPYAIDFLNPAPDADYHSVGPENFEWIVNAVADLAIEKALSDEKPGPTCTGVPSCRPPCRPAKFRCYRETGAGMRPSFTIGIEEEYPDVRSGNSGSALACPVRNHRKGQGVSQGAR